MDINSLVIRVNSAEVPQAEKRLHGMTVQSEKAERATGKLAAMSGKLMAALAAYASIDALVVRPLGKIVEVTTEAEKAQARLRAAGIQSAEQVKEVFNILEEMSSKPPFGLEETTDAFIKLVNQGLDPSKKALEAYSDLAYATGSSLTGVVDAIVAATNGQTRSLTQFGVKATQEIDGLVVTFRGNTEKIKGDAASIEQYMQRISAANYLGASAAAADTMGGKLDMLKDAWNDVWRAISDTGIGQAIKDSLDVATQALSDLETEIRSGALQEELLAFAAKWDGWATAASDAMGYVSKLWGVLSEEVKAQNGAMADELTHFITRFPENVNMLMKGIGAYAAWTYGTVVNVVSDMWATLKALTTRGIEELKASATMLKGYMTFDNSTVTEGLKALQDAKAKFDATDAANRQRLIGQQYTLDQTLEETIAFYMDERDATLANSKVHRDRAEELRKEYEVGKMLTEFFGDMDADPLGKHGKSRGSTVSEENRQAYEALRLSLVSEEQAVQESYQKRLKLIQDNEKEGSAARLEMEKALAAKLNVEMAAAHEATAARLGEEYSAEQDALQAALDRREISEQAFHERSVANWNAYMGKLGQISTTGTRMVTIKTLEMHSQVLGYAADISNQLSALVQDNSDAAKAMFIASKAIAIAQAIVNTELAATKALAEGGMYAGIPMSTIIRAAGYASVALMTATAVQEFQGKFEHGGMIGAGRVGLVGEAGPELVRGPAVVTSARTTADSGQGRSSGTQVNVHNYSGGEVQTQEREQPDGTKVIDVIVQRVQSELASSVARGVGPFVKSLQATYPLNRGARA